MTRRSERPRGIWDIAVVVVLAVAVGLLATAAMQRAAPAPVTGTAAPVPTFTFGARTPTPASSGSAPSSSPASRASERFLSVGSSAMWRATAGQCGTVEPLLERSVDGARTWIDVTPRYLGVGRIAWLEAFAGTEAQMIAGVASTCQPQALRTFTQGRFWESFSSVAAQYVDFADGSVIRAGDASVTAPCANATGLRASGNTIVLLCDGYPWSWDGSDWDRLPVPDAVAVAASGVDIFVAHISSSCTGIELTRFPGAAADSGEVVGCAAASEPSSPTAIAISADRIWMWSGNELLTVS